MGRYKSVLKAQADAKDFPHHVDIPVPPNGLGKNIDILVHWLGQALGSEWRHHGAGTGKDHVARFMFRTKIDSELFERAWKAGEFGNLPRG